MAFLAALLTMPNLRAWRERMMLSVIALIIGLIGIACLLAAGFRALVYWVGPLKADLIFGGGFLLLALLLWIVTQFRWLRRPRPPHRPAWLAVAAEGLALLRSLMRKDPLALALVAILLGSIRSLFDENETRPD